MIKTTQITDNQIRDIIGIWNNEHPSNICFESIDSFKEYLDTLSNIRYYLIYEEDYLIGMYFDFDRDDERWFSISVSSSHQGKGIGRKLIEVGKESNQELNGWVVLEAEFKKRNGDLYNSLFNVSIK